MPALTTTSAPPAHALRQALLADRERALTQLYRQAFPAVRRLVQRQGGSAQDAQDVFQDALVVFYEQAVGSKLELRAATSTYLISIARHGWQHELRRRARLPHEALPEDDAALTAEESEAADEAAFPVLDYVARLGEKCRNVLLSFYYFQQPLEQIAEANGYRSVRSATVQKFKCLERLRASVRAAFRAETIDS